MVAILIIGVLGIAFSLFYKKRKYLLNTTLVVLPFLLSSLFSIFYYGMLNHAYRFRHDRCIVEKRSGVGVMDKFGLEIIPYIYDNIAPNSYWSPAYYRATYNNQEGVLALNGTEIIPCIYDDIDTWLTTDNFMVKSGKLKGLYTPRGKVIVPCEYTKISRWRETSLIHVKIDDQEGLYSPEGQEILPCQFIICKELNGISLINRGVKFRMESGERSTKRAKSSSPANTMTSRPTPVLNASKPTGDTSRIFTTLTEIIYEANINGKLLNYGKLFLPERKK